MSHDFFLKKVRNFPKKKKNIINLLKLRRISCYVIIVGTIHAGDLGLRDAFGDAPRKTRVTSAEQYTRVGSLVD